MKNKRDSENVVTQQLLTSGTTVQQQFICA